MSTRFSDNYFRKVESALPPHESVDDLSIVASDDENSSSADVEDVRASTIRSRKNAPAELIRGETRAVVCLRYFILSLLLVSGIGMSIGFFNITSEADDSASQCSIDGTTESFVLGLEKNLQQIRSSRMHDAFTVSASFTSHVLESGVAIGGFPMQWPYVTIPHFEPRTLATLSSKDVKKVLMAPFVKGTEQNQFETYALLQQQEMCTFEGCKVIRNIYNVDGSDTKPGEFTSPIWQIAPFDVVDTGNLLMNLLSDPVQAIALDHMQQNGSAVWSGFNYDTNDSKQEAPEIFLFYPIFQDFKQVDIVGSLKMRIDLREHLESALPFPISKGLTLVVESCDNVISFSIDGEELVFEGTVDTEKANDLKTFEGAAILNFPPLYPYGQFITDDDNGIGCDLVVIVAPSSVAKTLTVSDDTSNRASVITTIVAITFCVLIFTFLIYDWLVERRQKAVITIANKSTAIVENLFPAQVRDRMLQNIEEKNKAKGVAKGLDVEQSGGVVDAGATPVEALAGSLTPVATAQKPTQVSVKQFLTTDQSRQANDNMSSQPIADLFPNTTVLFADIAGFTAWASQREPPQVFTLLETLFRSFDVIASKLKVFKVET